MSAQEPTKPKVTGEEIMAQIAVMQAMTTEALQSFRALLESHNTPEMPYSWNVRVQDMDGFEEQFTIRTTDNKHFFEAVPNARKWLRSQGYKPTERNAKSQSAAATTNGEQAPICAIHKTPMVKRSKDGRSWWSCNQKLEDGSWCPYKPK